MLIVRQNYILVFLLCLTDLILECLFSYDYNKAALTLTFTVYSNN